MDGGRGSNDSPGDADDLPGLFDSSEIGAGPTAGARPSRSGRFEVRALATIVPLVTLVPLAGLAFYPVYLLLSLPLDLPPYLLVFGLYAAVGLVVLTQPVHRALLTTLIGARSPTPSETDELQAAWTTVLRQAQIPEGRYRLAIVDSRDLSAAATGGTVVAVTTGALNILPPDELEGALAHELGHHRGPHGAVLPLTQWLMFPLAWLGAIGRTVSRASCLAAVGTVVLALIGVWALGSVTELATILVALVVVGLVLLVTGRLGELVGVTLGALIGRFTQQAADQAAVELGFGPQLAAALDRFARLGPQPADRGGIGGRIFGTVPAATRRLDRVRAQLD